MNTESIDDEEKFGLDNQHGLHEMTGYTITATVDLENFRDSLFSSYLIKY